MKVPDILVSGNHQEIETWRKDQMLKRTHKRRKDLTQNNHKNEYDQKNIY